MAVGYFIGFELITNNGSNKIFLLTKPKFLLAEVAVICMYM